MRQQKLLQARLHQLGLLSGHRHHAHARSDELEAVRPELWEVVLDEQKGDEEWDWALEVSVEYAPKYPSLVGRLSTGREVSPGALGLFLFFFSGPSRGTNCSQFLP